MENVCTSEAHFHICLFFVLPLLLLLCIGLTIIKTERGSIPFATDVDEQFQYFLAVVVYVFLIFLFNEKSCSF